MSNSNFLAVDLHVHTPASKCYKGNCDADEYVAILNNYIEHNVKVIAFTDHNSIAGYKQLMNIKDTTINEIDVLLKYEQESPAIADRISKLRQQLTVFEKITVLPGVEFEAKPGIHLLFIFDPLIGIGKIESFLNAGGYPESLQGNETVDILSQWDVLDALAKAKELGAITVAAHVDSDKGIYNCLDGNYRAHVFKSINLDAVSVNSVVNIEKIKGMLENVEYKRTQPLAFIQSSDHHHPDDCAKLVTYIDLECPSFACLVDAFKDPVSRISPTASPEVRSIIKQIMDDKHSIILDKLDNDLLCMSACAVLNNDYGYVLVGITNDQYRNIKGVDPSSVDFDEIKKIIKKNVSPDGWYYTMRIASIKWGTKCLPLLFFGRNSSKLFYCNGKHYHIDNQSPKESALESVIRTITSSRNIIDGFLDKHYARLAKLADKMKILAEERDALTIITKIESHGVLLSSIVDISQVTNYAEIADDNLYGFSSGNTYFTEVYEPVRSEDYYVRITPRRFRIESPDEEAKFNGPAIILAPGGATYLVEDETFYAYVKTKHYSSLVLRINDQYGMVSILSLIAWLKSSAFIWYCCLIGDSANIYVPGVFKRLIVPEFIADSAFSEEVAPKIHKILDMEKDFLESAEKYQLGQTEMADEEHFIKYVEEHNKRVDVIAAEIDEMIYGRLGIEGNTLKYLRHYLFSNNYHIVDDD